MSRLFTRDTFLLVLLKSKRLVIGSTKAFMLGKSVSWEGHTHDDRYYTESEVNTLLNSKANTNHTHSGYATTTALNNLTTRVSNLEGSVDMAKLVHTECAKQSSQYGNLICTYIASFVRVKRAGIDSSANGTSCGTGYIDVYRGCSGIIHTIGSPISVNYTSDGKVTLTTLYNNASDSVYLTLEFYNY